MQWQGWLAVLIGSLFASNAQGQQVKVTISPQALSLPEIARRLSVQGRRVECSLPLRDCAAVVCLKERSWEEACALLSAGLAVEFRKRPGSPDTWVMIRDSHVAAREQKWRDLFVRGLHDAMQTQAARYTPYLTEPYGKVRAQHARLRKEYQAAFEANAQQETEETRERANHISAEAKGLPDPQEWMAAKLLEQENSAAILETLQKGYTLTEVNPLVLADRDLLESLVASAAGHSYSEEPSAAEMAAHYRAFAGFSFDPETLLFLTHVVVGGPQARTQEGDYLRVAPAHGEHPIDSVFRGDSESGYRGLGKEAAQLLDAESKETQAFLQSPPARQLFQPMVETALTSVSQVVESWCRTTGQEAICELFPMRERLPAGRAASRLQEVFDAQGAWSLREQEGVLLVTDRLAFVDRLRSFPLPAFLVWERALHDKKLAPVPEQSPQLQAVLAYARSVTAAQNGAWLSLRGLYRGHSPGSLGRSRPLALFLSKLTDKEWHAFARMQSRGEPCLLPVSQLTVNFPEIIDSYRALHYVNGRPLLSGSLYPGFDDIIHTAILHLDYGDMDTDGSTAFTVELMSLPDAAPENGKSTPMPLDGTREEICRVQHAKAR